MMTNRKILVSAAACAALTAALVGCSKDGGGKDAGSKGKSDRTVTESPKAPEPFAGLTGQQIADKAVEATKAASSLKVAGSGKDDGKQMSIEFALSKQGNCSGEMGYVGSGRAEFLVLDKVMYMKGDEAFYKGMGKEEGTSAEETAAMTEILKGRWMKIPADEDAAKDMGGACDLDGLIEEMEDGSTANVTKGQFTDINGQKAITLTEKDGAETHTIYVAAEGKPYFLKIVTTGGDEPGTVTFSDYDKPVAATPPPADQVVDLEKMMGDAGAESA
ncbi:hypothetical protein [Streptomyces canus]|uniref:hypothetical protein n=1 Tax=Streptomyces canus TaxID=58343 RepID=UPI003CECAA68